MRNPNYVVYDKRDGRVIRVGVCQYDMLYEQAIHEYEAVLYQDGPNDPNAIRVDLETETVIPK